VDAVEPAEPPRAQARAPVRRATIRHEAALAIGVDQDADPAGHQSKAAAQVEGARRAVQGRTQAALLAALRETYEPLAPTIRVYRELAPPPLARPPGRGPSWPGSTKVSASASWARVDDSDPQGRARLWLRVDGTAQSSECLDDMQGRPIASTTWQPATLESPRIGAAASMVACRDRTSRRPAPKIRRCARPP